MEKIIFECEKITAEIATNDVEDINEFVENSLEMIHAIIDKHCQEHKKGMYLIVEDNEGMTLSYLSDESLAGLDDADFEDLLYNPSHEIIKNVVYINSKSGWSSKI